MVCSHGVWRDNLWFTGLREFLAIFLALPLLLRRLIRDIVGRGP